MRLIETSLTGELCFLVMLVVGQYVVLSGIDPLTVLAVLITVKALMIVVGVLDARRERKNIQ